MPDHRLQTNAGELAAALRTSGRKIVLAESCTGGLVCAALARVPGISAHLCGLAVVYRERTKTEWLGIDPELLSDPAAGAVSSAVTRELALAVLSRTPEATLSAAVTGHLGPDAPAALDGVVFIAVAARDQNTGASVVILEESVRLPGAEDEIQTRIERQTEAAALVLAAARRALHPTDTQQ